jgi:GTP-binding protein Era
MMMMHKAGFVNIIGNPNVGKSTLMNALVGEKLSIITSKAQTTRHRIMGIVNGEDFQIVYSDTPGILQPAYSLQEFMRKSSSTALIDADILLFVTDMRETPETDPVFFKKLVTSKVPVLVLLNKIDLSTEAVVKKNASLWSRMLPAAEVIPVSATQRFNLDKVFDRILDLLPESPPYYQKDALTDKSERFFIAEIIREKILMIYHKEVPYSVEIEVESFKEEVSIVRIHAIIFVARESQKGIIIGHHAARLKKTGTMARHDIERFLGKKVYLELSVRVKQDWRNNPSQLRKFGYR